MIDFDDISFDSPNDFFRKTNLIFHWILAVPLSVFIFLYLEKRDQEWLPLLTGEQHIRIVSYFLFPTSIAFLFLGFKGFKERIQAFKAAASLPEKLTIFYKSFIVQQILFCISSVLALIGLYLTGNNGFAIYYIIVLFLTSFLRPSPSRVCHSLKLNKEDREIIYKKKPFVV